jgi:hypothetical protein
MRTDLTLVQITALRTMLADQFEDDERGWIDALEGETDAFELVRRLLHRIEAEEGDRAALTEQMEARKVRRDRCDARIAAQREAIATVMKCAGLDKLPLPEATITLRETAPKLVVNDPAAVPHEYAVQSWKPSMDAIKAAFSVDTPALPNWLRIDDPRPSLTIRRK